MLKKIYLINSVIFDMDGVITNTMPDHYKAWRTVLKKVGIMVTHEDIYGREGQYGLQSIQEIGQKYGKHFVLSESREILREKETLFNEIVKLRFIVGARKLLKDLYDKRFTLALVTGTSRQELHKILPDEIYNRFSVVVTGDDVARSKPDPEPYLKALHLLNIKAEEAVVIENAPYGIRSAKGAGIHCIALETSLPRNFLGEADEIFSSIGELRENIIFEHLNSRRLVIS